MNITAQQDLLNQWIEEENQAHIKGWDFSHIKGRYIEEDDLPWDLRTVIKKYLNADMKLLDMETGGGEFLLSLGHPVNKTAAIEGYKPNVAYCKEVLLPLGIDFKEANGEDELPFNMHSFNIVTNRHGSYNVKELKRVLKKNGFFITQQVGAENDRELVKLLQPEITNPPYPEQCLEIKKQELIESGFEILESGEVFRPIRFYDVGALVWFAKIIEWEFPHFSVKTHLQNLYNAQNILETDGVIAGRIHRFYIVSRIK